MANSNAQPPPPPLTTPMLTGPSVEMAQDDSTPKTGRDRGLVTPPWMMFFTWVFQVLSGGVTPGTGSVVVEDYPTLTADAVILPVTPLAAGTLLKLFITEDATGGWKITWDASVKNAQTNIRTLANTYSVFELVGRVDPGDSTLKWFASGTPLTGQPI